MVNVVEDVEVKRVCYKSDNGCVFKAVILNNDGKHTDKQVNVLLTGKLAGEGFRLYQGQRFKVKARQHGEYINKHTGEIEEQIKATSIVEQQLKGENFISYIAFNDIFANIGIKTATALYKVFGKDIYRVLNEKNFEALTIAGFLNKLDQDKLQSATHIIIDECSMVDLYSMVRIFKCLEFSQKIIFVGDAAQLPPVGAGKVFHVLSDSLSVHVTRLTKVWRQDESTGIPMVSQSVREGSWNMLPVYNGKNAGVSVVSAVSENIFGKIEKVFNELGGIDEQADVKIICPTTKDSGWGTLGINRKLSQIYAGDNQQVCLTRGNSAPEPTGLKVGDVVMATVNNWEKDIMNGSLGKVIRLATISEVDEAQRASLPLPIISVAFDNGEVLLDENDIETLQWGYAITCHKAQGSQFRRVIIPVINGRMIDRTWIYTALTRGIKQVVFIGNIDLIKQAVNKPPTIDSRIVGLNHHIEQLQLSQINRFA